MVSVRAPRSTKAAQALLERFAVLQGEIDSIEAERREFLAKLNAEADKELAAFLPERDAILARLQEWWPGAADELTQGKRKSIELGGCEIGSRSSPAVLGVDGDEKKITAALAKLRWARQLVRVSVGLDRAAILKSIDGAHKDELAELGFSKIDGKETVFVKRVAQGGTLGS